MQILSWSLAVLLASSVFDLQQKPARFVAECEPVGIRVSTYMAMVLCWKTVDYLHLRSDFLSQANEYLGFLFMSDGKVEHEINRRFGLARVVLQALHQTVVLERKLRWKAKLSILPVHLHFIPHLW